MAQFSRLEVAQIMKDTGMVPLFFHNNIEVSKKVLKACYDGGARLMEFTRISLPIQGLRVSVLSWTT